MSVPLIRWDAPGPYHVAFSTRQGGVSDAPYESLNLGRSTRDDPENVNENRRRLCDTVGVDPEQLALQRQVHGAVVNRAEAGARSGEGDGLWTDEPACRCSPSAPTACRSRSPARTARPASRSCTPGGSAYSPGSSRRGSPRSADQVAAIVGPGIGPCCYEVGDDIAGDISRPLRSRRPARTEPRSLDRCGEGSPQRRRRFGRAARRLHRLRSRSLLLAPARRARHRSAGSDRLRRLRRFARTTNGSGLRSGRL